jgi:WD40 repeat protein
MARVGFAPDSRSFAALSGNGGNVLSVWSVADGKILRQTRMKDQGQFANRDAGGVSFTPDGRFIVVTGSDHSIAFFDAATLAWIRTLQTNRGTFNNKFEVAFHPTEALLAYGEGPSTVVVSTYEGAVLRQANLQTRVEQGVQAFVWSVEFSPDGKRILAAGGHRAHVLGADTLETIASFPWRGHTIDGARFLLDGRYVVLSSMSDVGVWSLAGERIDAAPTEFAGSNGYYPPSRR